MHFAIFWKWQSLHGSLVNFMHEKKSFSNVKKDNCRVFIRPSGTEPVLRILVEARNQKEVDSLSTKITTELSTKIYKISKTF